MVQAGAYPGVESIVGKYELHCCEDDALAGRVGWEECGAEIE